ncbi:MAG: hypothetical protein A3A61_00100 [Candidatus Woykebacteria bacterium RIFCSPLOWO2_01_FULL_43_14]|uniref:YwbE family protein n=2 Tax=Candidatus Woykeibacteriota TaxID=1817899 RepID=A0A1G1WSZ2_9BACT|nr:MAG: hypothetical protein A3J50_00325 [Candidatus Woykebacteria bacterium RIFCSPHIGHO2_02_FULL_43_16b]OGY30814.1 MAG: hypothetical protein A3A61_00100 [Candidatus Woykebacteria bacterium RIFCSPLOWO2_01_FULL_43_14]
MDTTDQRYPKPGDKVNVIQKIHYETGDLTTGIVKDVLTKSRFHHRGHKVRLTDGTIGRVQSFVDESGVQSSLVSNEDTPPANPTVYLPPEDELV